MLWPEACPRGSISALRFFCCLSRCAPDPGDDVLIAQQLGALAREAFYTWWILLWAEWAATLS